MLRRILDFIGGKARSGVPTSPAREETFTGRINFRVIVTEDDVDGGYIVECLNLPGCMSQGETVEEALDNIGEAIAGVLMARFERNVRDQEREIKRAGQPQPHELSVPISLGHFSDDRVLVQPGAQQKGEQGVAWAA